MHDVMLRCVHIKLLVQQRTSTMRQVFELDCDMLCAQGFQGHPSGKKPSVSCISGVCRYSTLPWDAYCLFAAAGQVGGSYATCSVSHVQWSCRAG